MEKVSSKNNELKSPRIAIIAFPWQSYSPYKFLSDIISILGPISQKIVLISGNTDRIKTTEDKLTIIDVNIRMHYLNEISPRFYSAILWFFKCLAFQIRSSYILVKKRREIDIILFYMAYPYYFLPLLVAKLFRIKTIEIITRIPPEKGIPKVLSLIDPIFFRLLDVISFESESLKKDFFLSPFENKIGPSGARYIDISTYKIVNPINFRQKNIGYVGRVTEQKGIINFINAIPMIAQDDKEIEFFVIGDGDLLDWIKIKQKTFFKESGIILHITGLVKDGIPEYLNNLKIIVLPSKSEGLPTIILEAMACGTIVLSTKVGALNEVIRDGETGFFLSDSSPTTIAKSCINIFNHNDLESISQNGVEVISDLYQYKSAVERYRKIINLGMLGITNDRK